MKALRPLILAAGLLCLWELAVWLTGVPEYLLPAPSAVVAVYLERFSFLLFHGGMTLLKILLGLGIGTLLGAVTALSLSYLRPLRPWLLPIFVASQAIPVFAIAPLLVLWFGYGLWSNVVMATLIIYFPVTAALYDGLRRVPEGWLDLARTMGADRWSVLWRIRVPAALPAFFSGLRIAAAVAPIGAVVGEWVGTPSGLGRVMLDANSRLQIDLMFAALLLLAILAVGVYFAVDRFGRAAVTWQEEGL